MNAMRLRAALLPLVGLLTVYSYLVAKAPRPGYPGLTVHEWGTFTSVAGSDGEALEWLPLAGPTDLPRFVEHFRNSSFKVGLRGTVRMETPVLYFYGSQEETVSVNVSFSKGLITEWYPRASRIEPKGNLFDGSLYQHQADGSITWDSVTVAPTGRTEFPHEQPDSRYYAARLTSSTPLRVNTPAGVQQEKFLFYRGVSLFSVPVSVRVTPESKVVVANRSAAEIPAAILFERRGDKVGFRLENAVRAQQTLESPELTASPQDAGRELGGILISQGLYQDEAQAMIETWRDSWFEEGSRLLYVVPDGFLSSVLPLSIKPVPDQTVRVFVGRLELITPATETSVEQAYAQHDADTLKKYGRFLEPILNTMIAKESNPARIRKLQANLNTFYTSESIQAQRQN